MGHLIGFGSVNGFESLKIDMQNIPDSMFDGYRDNDGYAEHQGPIRGRMEAKSIVLGKNVRKIGNYAFAGCFRLTGELIIPEGVLSIGEGAFYGCIGITGNLTVPESVVSLGYSAFSGAGANNRLDVYKLNVKHIPDEFFHQGEFRTKTLILGENVETIGYKAFYEHYESNKSDSNITENLILSNNLTTIGESAFGNCTLISHVSIPQKVANIGKNAFENWTSSQIINVLGYESKPSGYADGWNGNAKVVWKTE